MTRLQLQRIETDLAKRGYRKFTKCLTDDESYGWFKTFVLEKDGDGEIRDGYQIEFRVWGPYEHTDAKSLYGFDFWTSGIGIDGRYDMTANWKPIADIDRFEAMASEFHQLIRKYDNGKE